jgi:cell division protein FtsI (penicillin-binding protein 3)
MRLYPNGAIASHILGGASYGRESVDSAEVIGVAGVERFFDARLRDPERSGEPLALSLDLSVQATMEEVLASGMAMMNAKGAAGILMDVHTGEIVAMASLPDFDPNQRPPWRRAATRATARSSIGRFKGCTSWAPCSRSSPWRRPWNWASSTRRR